MPEQYLDPRILRAIMQRMGIESPSGEFSMLSKEPQPLVGQGQGALRPPPEPPPQSAGAEAELGSTLGSGTNEGAPAAASSGKGGWTDAALLAMAASLPALIGVVGKRNPPPSPHSVGGGKPRFEMPKMYDEKDRFRSLMASYLK